MFEKITELGKFFIGLSSPKQVVFIIFTLLILFGSLVVYFYSKNEKNDKLVLEELRKKELIIIQRQVSIDSLKEVLFKVKEDYFIKDNRRIDSTLKEIEKTRRSMNPVIKKINNQLNEINN